MTQIGPFARLHQTTTIAPSTRLSQIFNTILPPLERTIMSSKPSNGSKIISSNPLPTTEAKWTKLTKINWQDPSGKPRIWESAERSTRSKGGIDGIFSNGG
jgi:hypothetical protein